MSRRFHDNATLSLEILILSITAGCSAWLFVLAMSFAHFLRES